MNNTPFRNWVQNMYLDNCEEHRLFKELPYASHKEYFNAFKWWLKREFKYQVKGKS